MATDLERLVVQLSADIKKYDNALRRAQGLTNKRARQIETRFNRMNKALNAQFVGLGRNIALAFAGGASIRGAQKLLDASTRIENALKVAGLAGEELTRVYDSLFASAQRNAAPLEALTELYSRAALVQNELGVSTEELLGFTENIAMALRVSGKSAAESSGALLQLSQALGSGVVRAEEFNSILEGALPIAQAAAAGLKEANGSVAQLRNLMLDGKISSEAFFRAIQAGAPILEEKLAGAELTVSQSFIRLQNVLIDAAGRFDDGSDASRRLAGALDDLATYIENVDFSSATDTLLDFIEQVGWGVDKLTQFRDAIYGVARAISEWTGGDAIGQWLDEQTRGTILDGIVTSPTIDEQRRIRERIEGAFSERNTGGKSGRLGGSSDNGPEVKPVSIADYPILGDGSSAGGSSSTGQRADEYERLTQRIRESIAAVQAETAAQAGLNPLIDDYGYAVEKARVEQDLLNAAQEAGKDITPELSAGISDLAHQYATAYAEARKLSESQDEIRKRAEEWADVSKDVVGGFIQDLRNGTSAADALANALQKVADKLLNEVLDAIFEVNGAGGGLWGAIGGMLGGGFGRFPGGFGAPTPGVGLFAKGTDYAPGGLAIVGEEGPELVNLPRGSQVIPNHKLGGMGGPSITYAPQIDARGASVEAVARLEQIIAKDRAEFQAKVVNIVRDRPNKRW